MRYFTDSWTAKTTALAILCLALSCPPVTANEVSFAGYGAVKSSRSVATWYSDVKISKKIRAMLKQELESDAAAILVNTWHGVVSLTGSMDGRTEFKRAIELAGSVKGVKKVVPNLRVLKPTT